MGDDQRDVAIPSTGQVAEGEIEGGAVAGVVVGPRPSCPVRGEPHVSGGGVMDVDVGALRRKRDAHK